MPPLAHGFEVAERSGRDLHPIDVTTEEGRLTLLACVFPDETERFGLLDQAITHLTLWPSGERRLLALASQHPTTVTWLDTADEAPGV